MKKEDMITQHEFRWQIKKFSTSLLHVMGGNKKTEFAVCRMFLKTNLMVIYSDDLRWYIPTETLWKFFLFSLYSYFPWYAYIFC